MYDEFDDNEYNDWIDKDEQEKQELRENQKKMYLEFQASFKEYTDTLETLVECMQERMTVLEDKLDDILGILGED